MIQVLMLDLGGTLVHGTPPSLFPGVLPALEALRVLPTASGDPLRICLISDFTMPPVPARPHAIKAIFEQYIEIIASVGLKPLFEPVDRNVTLSTHIRDDRQPRQ